jgi:hypothetical protein
VVDHRDDQRTEDPEPGQGFVGDDRLVVGAGPRHDRPDREGIRRPRHAMLGLLGEGLADDVPPPTGRYSHQRVDRRNEVRMPDATGGAPYKTANGYAFPYGDYMDIAVTNSGQNLVTWGEGPNYVGPGGTWFTRGA